MNIVVKPFGTDFCHCRPDTTWEKENRDIYIPEVASCVSWTPVLFARISKAGKCIGEKFASRYYDSFNYGMLIYCHPEDAKAAEDTAICSCFDHSSLLPAPMYNPVVMEESGNEFHLSRNGYEIFATKTDGAVIMLEDAICTASRTTSLRIGDIVAVELAPRAPLASRAEGEAELKATFCRNELFSLKVIF